MRTDRNGRVAGVVLAAGASTRMGRNKLFFDIAGEPLLRRTVRRAIDGGLDPVIVVVGHEAGRTTAALAGLRCWTVFNPAYLRGINSSVRAGIAAVPDEADAAVVVLADMPFVSAEMIATLVARYRETAARLVVSAYGDVNAPPTLYDRTLFEEFRAAPAHLPSGSQAPATGEGCGKHVVKRHRHEAVLVAWPPGLLTDLDVPEDYDRVKALVEEGHHAR